MLPAVPPPESPLETKLIALSDRLLGWLTEKAFPLWAAHGIDQRSGGFVEMLDQHAIPRARTCRVRVQPRQVFCFAQAHELGWHGDSVSIMLGGLRYLTAKYRRADGLFRTLVGVNGEVVDDRALLYDQAFVLLGFSAAAAALERRAEFESRALELRGHIEARWRVGRDGFLSGEVGSTGREANPHMHLLEACLAWAEIGNDPGWALWAGDLAEIALAHFVNPAGMILEAFTSAWKPDPGIRGRLIEPGHQFEWAWLLLRCGSPAHRAVALRLIDVAEHAGVRNGVAINAIRDDFSVHDAKARLWPQAERLKSAVLAARVTGDCAYLAVAVSAAASLIRYLETDTPGLWFDEQLPGGELVPGPSPASSFYHLVSAITELPAARDTTAP
jgi:mannose/cellobiose epimerase-like protein (N-acyl-D-glucosamine 2-epimerase family)